MMAPPSSVAQVDAELADDRREGRPQPVPVDHPPLGQALGPGRADVVLTQHLQQRAPRQPGVGGRRDQGQRQPRQDQALGTT